MRHSAPRLTSAEVRTATLSVSTRCSALAETKTSPAGPTTSRGRLRLIGSSRECGHGLGSCIDLIDLPSVRAKIALVGVAVPVAIFIRNAVKIRRRALPNLQCCRISAQYAIDHAAQSATLLALRVSVVGVFVPAIVAIIPTSVIPVTVRIVIAVAVASALAIPVAITSLRAAVGLAHLLPERAQPHLKVPPFLIVQAVSAIAALQLGQRSQRCAKRQGFAAADRFQTGRNS